MQHYKVHLIDGITSKSVYIYFYGKMAYVTVNNKEHQAIVNEYDTPIFIKTYSTVSIEPFNR